MLRLIMGHATIKGLYMSVIFIKIVVGRHSFMTVLLVCKQHKTFHCYFFHCVPHFRETKSCNSAVFSYYIPFNNFSFAVLEHKVNWFCMINSSKFFINLNPLFFRDFLRQTFAFTITTSSQFEFFDQLLLILRHFSSDYQVIRGIMFNFLLLKGRVIDFICNCIQQRLDKHSGLSDKHEEASEQLY